MQIERITLIGTGNVAQSLGAALRNSGHIINEVYGRNMDRAIRLASSLGASVRPDLKALYTGSTLYIIAVSDDAIEEVVSGMPEVKGLVVHTSGTASSRLIASRFNLWGIFYPLQTFSPGRKPDFNKIPLIVSGSNRDVEFRLTDIAASIGSKSYPMNETNRRNLHLSAVLVNNFTNHLLALSGDFLKEKGLSPHLLDALMSETISKAQAIGAANAQTGPAKRGDSGTIAHHTAMLEEYGNEYLTRLYELFSDSISAYYSKGK
jgi:predicted short-subunit dehydrogenase-like oxidoreductase (DUF2520 family)